MKQCDKRVFKPAVCSIQLKEEVSSQATSNLLVALPKDLMAKQAMEEAAALRKRVRTAHKAATEAIKKAKVAEIVASAVNNR